MRIAILPRDGCALDDAGQRARRVLAGVCAGFVVVSAALVPLTLALGWDEIVYASRFGSFGPSVPFSAPRSRGVPALIAPVAAWSGSVPLLRGWLTLTAALALYAGFRPWLTVLPRPSAVPVAAAAYASLWFVLFYAGSAMPNHYTAMGTAAAVGGFVAPARSRWAPYAVAAGLFAATLMRPNDAVWVGGPLLLSAVFVRAWRRRERVLAVLVGTAAGLLPWVVEAHVRFGGVMARLAAGSEEQGGMGLTFSVPEHAGALDGPLLCRPCTGDEVAWPLLGWWAALVGLAALGLWRVRGNGQRTAACWAAVAVAASTAVTYLFFVGYAAPRFLMPAYALLVLPAALGGLALWDRAQVRRAAVCAVGLAVLGHLAVQVSTAYTHAGIQTEARGDWVRIAAQLREAGVRPPCVLKGTSSTIPIAYTAGCRSAEMDAPQLPAALLLRDREPPHWARNWVRHPVPRTYNNWELALPPRTGTAGAADAGLPHARQ